MDNQDENDLEVQEGYMDPSFAKAFGWYAVLNRIAQDDITRHNQVLTKKVLEILNQYLYIVEKEKELDRLRRQAVS